jgi:DNA-binding CsgD family transcriptional regulator
VFTTDRDRADARLTPSELLALQLTARGYSRQQIASLCGAAADEANLRRAFAVLGVATLEEAIAAARQRGLIS